MDRNISRVDRQQPVEQCGERIKLAQDAEPLSAWILFGVSLHSKTGALGSFQAVD